jgi:hypothetical protein
MLGAQYSSNTYRLFYEKFHFSSLKPAIGSNRQGNIYHKSMQLQ